MPCVVPGNAKPVLGATTQSHTHTHTHTHMLGTAKQEQSKKSGERKLLRSPRAALDSFRSVDRNSNVQLWTVLAV